MTPKEQLEQDIERAKAEFFKVKNKHKEALKEIEEARNRYFKCVMELEKWEAKHSI